MSFLPAAERAALQAQVEATMMSTAVWMRYSEVTQDGAGGRVESWLATGDPVTGQPTIPCKIVMSTPAQEVASAQVLGPITIYYRGSVPLRIALNVRDRLVMSPQPFGDGETYEVVDLDTPPTLLMQTRFGCRRIA